MANEYDSDEEEMLARADELAALEADDDGEDYSASQQGDGASYRSGGASYKSGSQGGPASRRSSAYSGYSERSEHSGRYSGDSGEEGVDGRSYRSDAYEDDEDDDGYDDDDGQGRYDHDDEEDEDDDYHEDEEDDDDEEERSYHTQRSHRSQTSAYSHHSQHSQRSHHSHGTADSGGTATKKSGGKKSKSKKKKKTRFQSSEPERPDQLSTIISKEEEERLLAYNSPPVPLRFSSQYLRGPLGVAEANVPVLGGGENRIKMSRKQRDKILKDGLVLNVGPLIVYDDDDDDDKGDGDGNPAPIRPGSLIYGCRGPAPSSTSPPSTAVSDPLGLHTADDTGNTTTSSNPIITAADLLRWLTSLVHHHSIRHVLCLLNSTELQSIAPPAGYQRLVESQLGVPKVTMVSDLTHEGARDAVLGAMEEAVRAGERIAVHCSGGEHRTGNVLALWLCRHGDGQLVDIVGDSGEYGTDEVTRTMAMSPEEAVQRVVAEASRAGVSRHPDVKQVQSLLEEGKLSSS